MDDEQRRAEILQAEEAIRLLAEEMAKASSATAMADEVRQKMDQAIEVLAGAKVGISELLRDQAALTDSSQKAVAFATEEAKASLAAETQRMRDCLKGIQDAHEQLRTIASEITQRTDQMAQVIEDRLSGVASALAALEKSLPELFQTLDPLGNKLSELSSSTAALATSLADARHEIRTSPLELAGQVRRSFRRERAVFVYLAIVLTLVFLGVCAALWRMLLVGGAR